MGAFDCELAALGYGRKVVQQDADADPMVEIEPVLGGRVKVTQPNDIVIGVVMYVSDENVVILRDKPRRHHASGVVRHEEVVPRRWRFYEV